MPKLSVTVDNGTKSATTEKSYSGPDAGRYFKAWQERVGPKDAEGKPTGTEKDFARWCADFIHGQLDSFVTQYEGSKAPIVPPPVETVDK